MLRPRLKSTIAYKPTQADVDVALLLGSSAHGLRLKSGQVSDIMRFLSLLSGANSAPQIAKFAGISLQNVELLLGQFESVGLIYDYGKEESNFLQEPEAFIKICDSFFEALRFDLSRHPLFSVIETDERMFLATTVEYFHLIKDACTHIEIAIDNAPHKLRRLLTSYLDEEAHHSIVIGRRIEEAFESSTEPSLWSPLAATEAAILKTRDLARNDTLAYIARCTLCEARNSDAIFAKQHLGHPSWTAKTKTLLEAFVKHYEQDLVAGHGSLLNQAIRELGIALPARDAARVLDSAHVYKHYLDNINYELMRNYSVDGASLPRLPTRINDYFI